MKKVDIFVKGLGSGREIVICFLWVAGFKIDPIIDVTPRAFGGCHSSKHRRV